MASGTGSIIEDVKELLEAVRRTANKIELLQEEHASISQKHGDRLPLQEFDHRRLLQDYHELLVGGGPNPYSLEADLEKKQELVEAGAGEGEPTKPQTEYTSKLSELMGSVDSMSSSILGNVIEENRKFIRVMKEKGDAEFEPYIAMTRLSIEAAATMHETSLDVLRRLSGLNKKLIEEGFMFYAGERFSMWMDKRGIPEIIRCAQSQLWPPSEDKLSPENMYRHVQEIMKN